MEDKRQVMEGLFERMYFPDKLERELRKGLRGWENPFYFEKTYKNEERTGCSTLVGLSKEGVRLFKDGSFGYSRKPQKLFEEFNMENEQDRKTNKIGNSLSNFPCDSP